MNRRFLTLCTVTVFVLVAREALAGGLDLRPHTGVGEGVELGHASNGSVLHAGGRMLLPANASQSYGIETTYLRLSRSGTHVEYLAVGIVLEQRLWDWFNMSIGTIGYVGLTTGAGNPFGLVTNLGWAPCWGRISPFITYRSDWIFSSPVVTASSVSAGATIQL